MPCRTCLVTGQNQSTMWNASWLQVRLAVFRFLPGVATITMSMLCPAARHGAKLSPMVATALESSPCGVYLACVERILSLFDSAGHHLLQDGLPRVAQRPWRAGERVPYDAKMPAQEAVGTKAVDRSRIGCPVSRGNRCRRGSAKFPLCQRLWFSSHRLVSSISEGMAIPMVVVSSRRKPTARTSSGVLPTSPPASCW